MAFTKDKDKHNQKCKLCGQKLRTVEDYIGGGSHYWLLMCDGCNKYYDYDTYAFELRGYNDKGLDNYVPL